MRTSTAYMRNLHKRHPMRCVCNETRLSELTHTCSPKVDCAGSSEHASAKFSHEGLRHDATFDQSPLFKNLATSAVRSAPWLTTESIEDSQAVRHDSLPAVPTVRRHLERSSRGQQGTSTCHALAATRSSGHELPGHTDAHRGADLDSNKRWGDYRDVAAHLDMCRERAREAA